VELGIDALLFAHADAHNKMARHRFSRSGTNTGQAICERHSTPRLRAQCNASQAIVLTGPTKSQRPASCFTTRAKSPQHKCKDHAILLITCAHPQLLPLQIAPRTYALITALHKCTSLLSLMPLKMRQPALPLDHAFLSFTSGAWPAHMKPFEGGTFCLLGTFACFRDMFPTFIADLEIYEHREKSQGNRILGKLILKSSAINTPSPTRVVTRYS